MLKYRTKNNCILYIDCCLHCAKQATHTIETNIHDVDKKNICIYNAINNDNIALNIQSICDGPAKVKVILDDYFMSHIKHIHLLEHNDKTGIINYIQNIHVQKNMKIVIAKTHACSYAYHKLKNIKSISDLQIDTTCMLFNLKKVQQIEQHVQLVYTLCQKIYKPVVIDIEVKHNNILEFMTYIHAHKNIIIYYNIDFLKSLIQTLKNIHDLYKKDKITLIQEI